MKSLRVLLAGGMVGKASGLVREVLMAFLFGASSVVSSFRVANAVFLFPMHALLIDALSLSFTPRFASALSVDRQTARQFLIKAQGMHLWLSLLATVVLFCLAGRIIDLVAPGFGPESRDTATRFVRVLSLAFPAYALSSIYGAALLQLNAPNVAAFRTFAQNASVAIGALVAYLLNDFVWVAIFFVGGYGLYALFAAHRLRQLSVFAFAFPIRHGLNSDYIAKPMMFLMAPMSVQAYMLVEKRCASLIAPEAIAAIDYARFLAEAIVTAFGLPLALSMFSALSDLSPAARSALIDRVFLRVMAYGVPVSAMAAVFSEDIVSLLFARGSFTASDAFMTARFAAPALFFSWASIVFVLGFRALAVHRSVLAPALCVVGVYLMSAACLLHSPEPLDMSGLAWLAGLSVAASALILSAFLNLGRIYWAVLLVAKVFAGLFILCQWVLVVEGSSAWYLATVAYLASSVALAFFIEHHLKP